MRLIKKIPIKSKISLAVCAREDVAELKSCLGGDRGLVGRLELIRHESQRERRLPRAHGGHRCARDAHETLRTTAKRVTHEIDRIRLFRGRRDHHAVEAHLPDAIVAVAATLRVHEAHVGRHARELKVAVVSRRPADATRARVAPHANVLVLIGQMVA